MTRVPFIAANWKMNKNLSEAVSFAKELKEKAAGVNEKEILICPSFTLLNGVYDILKDSNIFVGSQNIHFEGKGAFTGEISASMIKDFCSYVIIGHSERRQYFKEDEFLINKKIKKALESGIKVIFCIGEHLEQREQNETFSVLKTQLIGGLKNIEAKDMVNIIIAYEPVWAIGTGKTATPEIAEEAHSFIRKEIKELYDENVSEDLRILYGGSVKPENASELMKKENIDGSLVGGASLNIESFMGIINNS